MSSKFRIGETTSQKADAASASKLMVTVRDNDGASPFTSSEFLTSQQVSSFLSRMSSKRKIKEREMTDNDIEENQNVKNEKAFCELRCEILQEVAHTHRMDLDDSRQVKILKKTTTLIKFARHVSTETSVIFS